MYLTALHVRDTQGREDWQAYLHSHIAAPYQRFPVDDPLSVPRGSPGVLVAQLPPHLPPGGNAVLSYLDIIAEEGTWQAIPPWTSDTSTRFWHRSLDLAELMVARPLPWVVEVGAVYVVFNALPVLDLTSEYARLLQSAMRLWESWRQQQGLR